MNSGYIAQLINQAEMPGILDFPLLITIKEYARKIAIPAGHRILRSRIPCRHCIDGKVYTADGASDCPYCKGLSYNDKDEIVKAYQIGGSDFYMPAKFEELPEGINVPVLMKSEVYRTNNKETAYKALLALSLVFDEEVFNHLLNTYTGKAVWDSSYKEISLFYQFAMNG